jgi:glycosyltransferase A (GT-A) superfamily protein (DUF2064 family)
VIGPAEDGGYWLLGLRAPMPFLFEPMAWGTETVFAETMARFEAWGIAPAVLERLPDLDRPEDLGRWPELAGPATPEPPHGVIDVSRLASDRDTRA